MVTGSTALSELDHLEWSSFARDSVPGLPLSYKFPENQFRWGLHCDGDDRVPAQIHNTLRSKSPLVIYTDGSSDCGHNDNRAGGWAFVIRSRGQDIAEDWGASPNCDNNRAELLAAAEGIHTVASGNYVYVMTDSLYVYDVINGIANMRCSIDEWIENSMRVVRDTDIIQALATKMANLHVTSSKVRRRTSDPLRRCDCLAKHQRKFYSRLLDFEEN